MDEKVVASDYIIIGKVIRVICREYDQRGHRVLDIEGDRCNDGWSKSTDWVLEADVLLCSKAPPDPTCCCALRHRRSCRLWADSAGTIKERK